MLLSAVAYFWGKLFPGAVDPFVASKPVLDPLFGGTMFLIGSLLPQDEVRQLRRRWHAVLVGTATQYISMPLLAYVIGRAAGLSGELFAGFVLVGCVPGAMASNVLTLTARGNVSYSVSLTTLATLLSPIVVPFALWLTLGASHELDPVQIAFGLILQVVGPVILGYLLARHSPWWQRTSERIGPPLANLVILWIIAMVVALNRERLQGSLVVILPLLWLNILGYLAGYLVGRGMGLPDPMRRALTLEIGMQNAGLGTLLAARIFASMPAATIPPAAYTFGCMLTGTMLAHLWARSSGEPRASAGAGSDSGAG